MNPNSLRTIGQNLFKFIRTKKLAFSLTKLTGTQSGKSSSELYLMNKLRERIPNVTDVDVIDISHGCGDMYRVFVASSEFQGKTLVQQHRLIQQALKEEVKNWHGLTIETETPKLGN